MSFNPFYSTITAAPKVVNYISVGLDKKQHCAALFIDMSKVLKLRLLSSGLSDEAVAWFSTYLSNRSRCIRYDSLCSDFISVHNGVPHSSVLGPLLFTVYVNNLGQNMSNVSFHFYAYILFLFQHHQKEVWRYKDTQSQFTDQLHYVTMTYCTCRSCWFLCNERILLMFQGKSLPVLIEVVWIIWINGLIV